MRLALGAKRSRIVRQLLTESLMVSLMGTALGTAIAMEGTRALVVFLSADGMALVLNLHPDWRVLYFAGVIAIGTGLLIGAAPAFGGTEIQPNDALKQTRIGLEYVGHKFRFGRALVTLQVALAAVLLTGSMLFARTLQNLKWQNLGFDRNNIVFVSINATKAGLKQTQLAQLYTELLEGLRSDPQIRSASLTDVTPIGGSFSWKTLKPELWPALSARQRMLYTHDVSPQYFQTLGIKLVRGRDFIGSDSLSSISAGILSRSAAQTLFPGQDPVGQLLRIDETTSYRIVGEVDDAKYASLRDEAPITIYTKTNGFAYSSLAIRAELDRSTVVREVRRLLKATGKDIRLTEAVAMVEQIDRALLSERLIAMLASFFAMLAIVLVAIGVFGTVGYSATRRTSEIGLRLALGSPQARVLWMVMRQALLMSALGLAGGVPIAVATAYLTRSLLYGVTSYDPLTLSMTAGLILGCYDRGGFHSRFSSFQARAYAGATLRIAGIGRHAPWGLIYLRATRVNGCGRLFCRSAGGTGLIDHLFRREARKMVSYFSEVFETLNRASAAGNAQGSGKACGNLKGFPTQSLAFFFTSRQAVVP